jgi:hypothetical protein
MAINPQSFLPGSGVENGKLYPIASPGTFSPGADEGGLGGAAVEALSNLFDLYGGDSSDEEVAAAEKVLRMDALAEGLVKQGDARNVPPSRRTDTGLKNSYFDNVNELLPPVQKTLEGRTDEASGWLSKLWPF